MEIYVFKCIFNSKKLILFNFNFNLLYLKNRLLNFEIKVMDPIV